MVRSLAVFLVIIAALMVLILDWPVKAQSVSPQQQLVQLFAARDPGAADRYAGSADSGVQAWSESYYLQAYDEMFLATNNVKYLQEADADIKKDLGAAAAHGWQWTTASYSADQKTQMAYIVHDGMILTPIAEFVRIVYSYQLGALKPDADVFLDDLRAHFAHKWDQQYCEIGTGIIDALRALASPCSGGGYGFFRLPAWDNQYPGLHPGISLPFNQSDAFARFLLKYSMITGDTTCFGKASAIAKTLKAHMYAKGGGLIWPFAADLLSSDGARYMPVSDSSHANIDIEFVADAAAAGTVFNGGDTAKIAATFLAYTDKPSAAELYQFIDGSGALNASGYTDNLDGYARLAGLSAAVKSAVLAVLANPKSGVGGPTYELAIANLAAVP